MAHNPSRREREIRERHEREAHLRDVNHQQRSKRAWEIAEKRGTSWRDFLKTPLPHETGDTQTLYPWTPGTAAKREDQDRERFPFGRVAPPRGGGRPPGRTAEPPPEDLFGPFRNQD
ncbi:MAG: hypothetical protein JWO82_631 [Akkermansiaceae bacterium]|nr:hypothetical protein [Akkermansiaceae bacterium]